MDWRVHAVGQVWKCKIVPKKQAREREREREAFRNRLFLFILGLGKEEEEGLASLQGHILTVFLKKQK